MFLKSLSHLNLGYIRDGFRILLHGFKKNFFARYFQFNSSTSFHVATDNKLIYKSHAHLSSVQWKNKMEVMGFLPQTKSIGILPNFL